MLLLNKATISMLNTATRGRATAMAANRVIARRVVPLEASCRAVDALDQWSCSGNV